MVKIFKNIAKLYTVSANGKPCKKGQEMQDAGLIENAFLIISEEKVVKTGSMNTYSETDYPQAEYHDCEGRIVVPGFVDSHTHLVFPRTREEEFVYKIKGMSYEEIARRGGGILNSARALTHISEEELLTESLERCRQLVEKGTTTLEIKSGYGLSPEGELKLLRVARELKAHTPQTIKTTFLGAHAIPAEYKENRKAYIDLVCEEMIPAVASEKLADYIDVFCETGFFTESETERILLKGAEYGLIPKIHANQLDFSGGVKLGVRMNALSVDHLERITDDDIQALQSGETVPTLLPSCSFFLREPYGPARKLIEAGLPLCLATDFNPGSSPSGDMQFVISLGCIYMRLLPEEALVACTLNGANALGAGNECGSLEAGKRADFLITKPIENLSRLAYSFTENLIAETWINGRKAVFNPAFFQSVEKKGIS